MSEPSKEALELAAAPIVEHINSTFGPFAGSVNLRRKFAAVVQRLIDERDEARNISEQACLDTQAFKVRAEVAESDLAKLVDAARRLLDTIERHAAFSFGDDEDALRAMVTKHEVPK